ncbi:MAG: TA system VapC family ribonuclease toxin [Prosthecobacter sp.]|nr:TA system VapC family ribonuclease toxin [Prosthecobacter sp.]
MAWLLDGNVLTALAIDTHVHHQRALTWFYATQRDFVTCAITEGTLLRMHMMSAADSSASAAWATLRLLRSMAGHEFWDDGCSYDGVSHQGLTGHRQVTDAWLAELARRRGGKLATMDKGLSTVHRDVADFVPEN